jgi:Carboxypeptidase regulatory-like domain
MKTMCLTRRRISHSRIPLKGCVRACALFIAMLALLPALRAQVTATINGTVTDKSGSVIPNAKVTLQNEATQEIRNTIANGDGYFAFPALLSGSYSIRIEAGGFKGLEQHGITVNAGDVKKIPNLTLDIGQAQETVMVSGSSQIIPVENGQRAAVLDSKDIQQLALESRNLTELLKVLPGVTSVANGISNGPMFNAIAVGVDQSAVGNGLNANGAPNRGGTSQLSDGVDIDDPGCDCNSIAILNPDMTQEVSVQTSNFGADAPHGPVVINTISKSGGADYHGEGYFYARNDVLNANDWQSNHNDIARGAAHYYYPGGNAGGPVPFTHKNLFFWGGYENIQQNTGNANILTSFIPTPDMMAGNFTNTAANQAFCQGTLSATNTNGCNDLTGTILPDGTTVGQGNRAAGMIPAQFIDPGALALAKIWPAANANPASTPGGYNYYQVQPGTHNGWLYRLRVDYNLNQNNSFFISYQQGYDSSLAQGNGAHIYWTPANSIPYPGGGLLNKSYSKALAGHFTHIFSPTLTNEFIASWGYGNFPYGSPNPSAAYKSTLGYPGSYGSVFNSGSKLIPSYSSAGNLTFPDFSEPDIFENASGTYLVRKEMPAFADNLTKVWGTHTIKVGAYTENVGNIQGNENSPNGNISSFSGQNKNALTGQLIGSPKNPTANFLMGNITGYSENNAAPVSDMAYQTVSFYGDDTWKVSSRFTLQYGVRFDHLGHWYDRQHNGMAVFFPDLVASDFGNGQFNPGLRWHAIDSKIPKSGQPDAFAYVEPRFGLSYDLFGTGKTILRGGWGEYRFTDQYNDFTGSLTTAQGILTYGLPGQSSVLLSQIGGLPVSVGNGSVNALSPTDDSMPVTYAYNFTVSQQMPWNTLFELAYVGNQTTNLVVGGESVSGSGFGDFTNYNKVPVGAFFHPDPATGVISPNPENLGGSGSPNNKEADYRPYGYAYGTNTIDVNRNIGYANYNGMQVSWVKRSDKLTFNLNYTWSKSLGTGLQIDPFNINNNYAPLAIDRPNVINTSYAYNVGNAYHGMKLLEGVANGWTISGITTWQAGGNLQALNNPNFGMSLAYVNLPANASAQGITSGIGNPTFYGTSASFSIQPEETCDPTANTGHNQKVIATCFTPPSIGTFGPSQYRYISGAPYFDSDLAVYKTFHITERQGVQFRASAFNFLNHPLPQFSGSNQLTLHYNVDYASKAYSQNASAYPSGNPDNFGVLDNKAGAPTQRILELAVKYTF